MESSYIFKEFFDRTLDTKNYECRSSNYYVNTNERENYLFNSSINGIEDSDLIFLIGSNPRFESTILNARIRKSFVNNSTKIISLNEIGDLTYPYQSLNGQTKTIVDIFEGNNQISKNILDSKKPLIILGESFFKSQSSEFLFDLIKNFLKKNNKINDEWNSLNKLTSDASTVGSLDLKIINEGKDIFSELESNNFEIVYLLGQDNLNFTKKDEFIIYQGSHGDKGADIADIILPGAAYTEQSGYFTNLEGKLQKAYKASYPPGEAKEDWQIINELAETMNNRKLFNDKDELKSSMFNFINLQKENKTPINVKQSTKEDFENEELIVDYKDYYFSNVIARSSKTMLDCHNSKVKIKKTGTDG
jgi:NADH-quinone oxidoreductase subunit G